MIHIRPDHFYIQTAKDKTGPWFSYRHGECAFRFDPDRWYDMTVEFLKDEVIAHLDREHLAYAQHPMLDKARTYLALQVDQNEAQFDDFQVFTARSKKGQSLSQSRELLTKPAGKFPVKKLLSEEHQIQKTNGHEWYYQRDKTYRDLVNRVALLDEEMKEKFPAVSQSHKDYRKKIDALRKELLKNDPKYKEILFATHRAERAIDAFLAEQSTEVNNLPNSRKRARLELLKEQFEDDHRYRELVNLAKAASAKLVADYPQLFVSDEVINAKKKAEFEKAKRDPEFVKSRNERAAAYREQETYLLQVDSRLAELSKKIEKENSASQE